MQPLDRIMHGTPAVSCICCCRQSTSFPGSVSTITHSVFWLLVLVIVAFVLSISNKQLLDDPCDSV